MSFMTYGVNLIFGTVSQAAVTAYGIFNVRHHGNSSSDEKVRDEFDKGPVFFLFEK